MVCLDFIDIDNLILVEDDHVNRLSGSVCKIPQKRLGNLSDVKLAEKEVAQFHELQPQGVVSCVRVLPDIRIIVQRGEETMRRSLGQLKLQGKISDADSPGILPELL